MMLCLLTLLALAKAPCLCVELVQKASSLQVRVARQAGC